MTAYGRRGHFATLLSETPTKKHTPYSKFKDAARDGTRDITRRPRAVQRNVGFVVRIRPKCKHSATATIISRRLRAQTKYCNSTCQHDHWRRGHKQICKKIHRGGNAEKYYADKKYKEAVAVAVKACAAEEKYGLAPGILGRDAPAGKDKAPSIKEMKATIRKAGFGVADLVEKSDVVKRYQEALARLGK